MMGLGVLAAACGLGGFPGYDIVSTQVSRPHAALERVVYEVEVDDESLNRFAVTHVRSRRGGRGDPLLLLSPFTLPGAFYEISESGNYVESAAGRLAKDGFDVWLVDQRRTRLPPGSCETTTDCGAMAAWDFDALSEDALFALSLLKAHHPRKKPVVGGFSAGSNAALATVNRAPREFSGVFLYEGTFFTNDPDIAAHNDGTCATLEGAIAAGQVFDPSAAVPGLVLNLAAADPGGLSPLPLPPGTTNREAMLLVFGFPPPAGALSPTSTFIRNLVDMDTQSFIHTDEARLLQVGPLFDSYAPLGALRDLACGLAGHDDRHFHNVGEFRGDVLIFVEGTGFGPAMFDTATLFEEADSIEIDSNPELGEADPYFHRDWERVFYRPLKKWLKRTL
jgi:pimeloyl-ACP methyl ester carboxylesterase